VYKIQALCGPTFQVVQAHDGMKNNPDVVDDLYRLAQKYVHQPRRFLLP